MIFTKLYRTFNSSKVYGKPKDQPVEILETDDNYQSWLLNQDWFRSKL